MKPISELKHYNDNRILLQDIDGILDFGYCKDNMILINGNWNPPSNFVSFIPVRELKTILNIS